MLKGLKFFSTTFIIAIVAKLYSSSETSSLRQLEDPSLDPQYDLLFNVRNIQCSTVNCIPPSVCVDVNTCKCLNGMVNFADINNTTAITGAYCQYQQKKQLTAFLLQFFVFNGAGQFYVGNIKYAVPQLIICLLPCILVYIGCCIGMSYKKDGERPCTHLIILIIQCTAGCAVCGWWLADVIIFGMNKFTDSNGVPLQSW